jgi:hypothetical protein
LFVESTQCLLSTFHPYYLCADFNQITKQSLIKELAHRFSITNFFSEEFIPYFNAY